MLPDPSGDPSSLIPLASIDQINKQVHVHVLPVIEELPQSEAQERVILY